MLHIHNLMFLCYCNNVFLYIVNCLASPVELWRECTFGCLTNDLDETKSFDEWILKISEVNTGGPNDGEVEVEFPEDVVVRSIGDHIHSIVSTLYPSFENHLDDPSYFQDKAILVQQMKNSMLPMTTF
uniref:DNA helicase n=1 Tax=Lactuca sativa TaxID=4236 RepID=A0A9R1X5X2_LACSA|nr:hypothetical protein LSAT_V11C600306970 [Lactuca sativa]